MAVSIEIHKLNKTFSQSDSLSWRKKRVKHDFTALNDLSVVIPGGSFVTIFGPNGSGKSTLFRLIAGLDEPTSGTISIDGKPVSSARIGFVFQNYRDSMLTWRTALGNVRLALEARHIPVAEQDAIARQHLARVGMEQIADKPFYSLSGGQAQLVAIARAFAYEPDILLMDEPFSALDFQTSMGMMETLSKLWQETGITTVFISHDIDEAVYLADRVMILTKNPGRVQKIVKVSLKRPRPLSILTNQQFYTYRSQVLSAFTKGSK